MTQEKMEVNDAALLFEDLKLEIYGLLDRKEITYAIDTVAIDTSVSIDHHDSSDMNGKYGTLQVRIYWKDDSE